MDYFANSSKCSDLEVKKSTERIIFSPISTESPVRFQIAFPAASLLGPREAPGQLLLRRSCSVAKGLQEEAMWAGNTRE
jgi:hypothetical protein